MKITLYAIITNSPVALKMCETQHFFNVLVDTFPSEIVSKIQIPHNEQIRKITDFRQLGRNVVDGGRGVGDDVILIKAASNVGDGFNRLPHLDGIRAFFQRRRAVGDRRARRRQAKSPFVIWDSRKIILQTEMLLKNIHCVSVMIR